MKNLLFVAALLAALCPGRSAWASNDLVMQTSFSSITVTGLAISSQTGSSILGTNNGWRQVCIQNWDTANALYCNDAVSVSTSANVQLAALGNIVPPAVGGATLPNAPLCFAVVADKDWFCRTGNQSATSTAVITKAK